jgi:hypothetical protein
MSLLVRDLRPFAETNQNDKPEGKNIHSQTGAIILFFLSGGGLLSEYFSVTYSG